MKDTLSKRLWRLFRSETHDTFAKKQDPKIVLMQHEESIKTAISGVQDSVISTVELLRDMEHAYAVDASRLERINLRIPSVANDIEKLKATGDVAEATRLEGILHEIVREQIRLEKSTAVDAAKITKQKDLIAGLRKDLEGLVAKQESFTNKRNELVAREANVVAQSAAREALNKIGSIDTGLTSDFERSIREQEATEKARKELSTSHIDHEFAMLEEAMESDKRMKGITA